MFKIYKDKFIINNKEEFLISAEIHYFRIDCENWRKVIEHAINIGCNSVAFYTPWFVHEYKEGEFDFVGKTNPKYNLVGFLELIKEYNLYIILRPGPYIYAEMTNLGLPMWLVNEYSDDKITTIVDGELTESEFNFAFAHNNPVFREKTKNYILKIIETCKPYLDSIIMVQLCNEIPGLDVDDHSTYRNEYLQNYIRDRFELEKFNEIFDKEYDNYNEINILDICEHKNYKHLHLEEYYTEYYTDYFKFLKNIYEENDFRCNYVHNAYNPRAISLFPKIKERMEELIVGVDNYYSLFGSLNDKSCSYFCEFGVSYIKNILNNVPYVLEHECGFWLDSPKVYGEELYLFTFWSLLYGYKGINLYLFHQGMNEKGMGFNSNEHNWQSLVDMNGEKTEKYDWVKKAIDDAKNTISVNEDVMYDCALSFEHFPGLIWDKLSKQTEEFYHFLFKANHQPEIIDIIKSPIDELKKYKVIYFLVDEKLSHEMQLRIIELIELKLPIVLVGNMPTNDWYETDCTLIEYLDISIKKQKKDGFSQKLLFENREILFDYKNIDIITSNMEVKGISNYNQPIILVKDNLIIINGFIKYSMKDQLEIIKFVDTYNNIEHNNYGSDLRIIKKVDGTCFVLNPNPFKVKECITIDNVLHDVSVDGYHWIIVK